MKLQLTVPEKLQPQVLKLVDRVKVVATTSTTMTISTDDAYDIYNKIGYNAPYSIWLLKSVV